MSIPGTGLVRGLAVTWRNLTRRAVTAQYPDALPDLPPRTRGVIALIEENCTVCMLCARECPSWCIYIDSHKDVIPATTEGGKDKSRNVLDRFAIDFSLCMYCSICVEVCPFDALHWSPEFEYAEVDIRNLTHEKDRLRDWMWTVPAPSAFEHGHAPPKEIATAEKAVERASAAGSEPAVGGGAGRPDPSTPAPPPLADSSPATAPPPTAGSGAGNQSRSSVAGRPDPSTPAPPPAPGSGSAADPTAPPAGSGPAADPPAPPPPAGSGQGADPSGQGGR